MKAVIVAVLFFVLSACAATKPRSVIHQTLPDVCPAPRTAPVKVIAELGALPAELPILPTGLSPSQTADAILYQRIEAATLYQRARKIAESLAAYLEE